MGQTEQPGGLSREDIQKIVSDTVGAAVNAAVKPIVDAQAELTKNVSVLADTMSKLPPATTRAAETTTTGKPAETKQEGITAESVQKLISDGFAKIRQEQSTSAARDRFITERMAKLPAVYRNLIGTDPAKFEEELKAVQSQYEKDFVAGGGKVTDVAPPGTSNNAPKTELDATKLTPKQFAATYLPKVPGAVAATGESQATAAAA